jgi:hypothetical protein
MPTLEGVVRCVIILLGIGCNGISYPPHHSVEGYHPAVRRLWGCAPTALTGRAQPCGDIRAPRFASPKFQLGRYVYCATRRWRRNGEALHCQATRQTDPLTTRGIDPFVEGGRSASSGRASSPVRVDRWESSGRTRCIAGIRLAPATGAVRRRCVLAAQTSWQEPHRRPAKRGGR